VQVDRRRFLAVAAGAMAAGLAGACRGDRMSGAPQSPSPPAASDGPLPPLATRPLGRTGFAVTVLALGGQGVLERPGREDDAIALIRRAVELGVNYFDTAIKYGPSRANLGRALEGTRDRIFLASKVHARDGEGAQRQLEESLKLLRTDRIDLLQLHDLKPGDLGPIFAKGGAYEALVRMRESGLVRFLGVTGHTDPAVLLEAIRRERFDNVLMALNCADPHFLPFGAGLLDECNRQGIGVVAMKVLARGALFRDGSVFHDPGVRTIDQAVHYVLSRPVSAALVGCDSVAQLEQNVTAARRFRPLAAEEMRRLEAATRPYALEASYYKDWWRLSRWERLPYMPIVGRRRNPTI
jgi:aryl-alcohol dehydrogenase-like predicted oxidoreductase